MKTSIRPIVCAGVWLAASTTAFAHISEKQNLTAFDASDDDHFGAAAAIDGVTSAVGAPGETKGSGAVYVFDQIPQVFQAKLFASDFNAGDNFGWSVGLSGDTVVTGAPRRDDNGNGSGAAYVFTRSGTVWSEQAKLLPSVGAAGDFFGFDVRISGDTIVVGAPGHDAAGDSAGAAYVFVRSGTTWSEQQKLTAGDANDDDQFGTSVSIDGDVIVVGAPFDSDSVSNGGSAYVFERSGTIWTEDTKLTDASAGMDDEYGTDVDVHQTRIVVGSPKDDDRLPDGGAVFVYDEIAGDWTLNIQLLTEFVTVIGAQAGNSVAVSEGVILGGAKLDLATTGQVYFWAPQQDFREDIMIATNSVPGDQFGASVDVSGCWAVIGALFHDTGITTDGGSAYLHALRHPQELYCTAGTSASGCTPNIGAIGIASASASVGFNLFAQNVEGSKDGMFYIGTNGRQANSWGSGTSYQCVVPPVIRGGLLVGRGTNGACDNGFIQDWNSLWCPGGCPKPFKNPGSGATVQAQFWYRDPLNTSNQTTSLTNAIEFEVCP